MPWNRLGAIPPVVSQLQTAAACGFDSLSIDEETEAGGPKSLPKVSQLARHCSGTSSWLLTPTHSWALSLCHCLVSPGTYQPPSPGQKAWRCSKE